MCIITHLKTRDIIKALKADGWRKVRQRGSHQQFKHPTKPGLVTVKQGEESIDPKTLGSIERQSGLGLRDRPPKKKGR